jgi:hypothetical protein
MSGMLAGYTVIMFLNGEVVHQGIVAEESGLPAPKVDAAQGWSFDQLKQQVQSTRSQFKAEPLQFVWINARSPVRFVLLMHRVFLARVHSFARACCMIRQTAQLLATILGVLAEASKSADSADGGDGFYSLGADGSKASLATLNSKDVMLAVYHPKSHKTAVHVISYATESDRYTLSNFVNRVHSPY